MTEKAKEPSASTSSTSEPALKKQKNLAADPTVFDSKFLMEMCDDDMAFAKQLVDLYKETTSENLVKLRQAYKDSVQKEAILYSHDIKGSSANLGALHVRWHALEMETLNKAGKLSESSKLLPELEERIATMYQILDDFIADPSIANSEDPEQETKETVKDQKRSLDAETTEKTGPPDKRLRSENRPDVAAGETKSPGEADARQ